MRTLRRGLAVVLVATSTACSDGGDSGDNGAAKGSTTTTTTVAEAKVLGVQEFDVPAGLRPHDVAAASDGIVWYTAQGSGELGRLDPSTGDIKEIALGNGSRPHGVVLARDGAPWITDGGLNAIVRVDPKSFEVRTYPLSADRAGADLNTAAFDPHGTLWFTGQSGVYGRLLLPSGKVDVFDAPKGKGPYGITASLARVDEVYFASLAGSYLGRIDVKTGAATAIEPPTANQGTRRVWFGKGGRVWCSQWDAGQLAMYDPDANSWREWKLPGDNPQPYAVYVDFDSIVWLSDFGANALVRFDPETEEFSTVPLPSNPANVRQLHGRFREVWGAESAADKLVVVRL